MDSAILWRRLLVLQKMSTIKHTLLELTREKKITFAYNIATAFVLIIRYITQVLHN